MIAYPRPRHGVSGRISCIQYFSFNATRGQNMQRFFIGIAVAVIAASVSFTAEAASNSAKASKCKRSAQESCQPHCTPSLKKMAFDKCMKQK